MKGIFLTSFLLSIGVIENATINCTEALWTDSQKKSIHGLCTLEDNNYLPGNSLTLNRHEDKNTVVTELRPYTVYNLYHPNRSEVGVQDLISFPNSDIAYHAMTYYIQKQNGYITICTPLDCVTLHHTSALYLRSVTLQDRADCEQFMEIGPQLISPLTTVHSGFCIEKNLPSTHHYTTLLPKKAQHSLLYVTHSTPTGFSTIDHSSRPPITTNNPIDPIPTIPSTLTKPSTNSPLPLPQHPFEVRDLSSSIDKHPFFSVTGSFSPLKDYPNRLFLIKTPRRVYSVVKDGADKVALLEDTGREDLSSFNEAEDKSSFILLQTFPHKLLVLQEKSRDIRYSAMPRHRYGYERRKAKGIVTGVRAFQHFLNTQLLMNYVSKNNTAANRSRMFYAVVEHANKGESNLFSVFTYIRNSTNEDYYKPYIKTFIKAGARNWDEEGMSELKVEKEEKLNWDGSDYWVTGTESLVMKDLIKDEKKERKKKVMPVVIALVCLIAVSAIVVFFIKHNQKKKKAALLTGPNDSLNP